ncbi:hypothetical protein Q9Q99_01280 [Curtobacterium flaccumfaciens]|nr:hypothetical protein Q9Q99_01280 [Curtobacterium flaccumfaciens]
MTHESATGRVTGDRSTGLLDRANRALSSRTAFVVVLVAFLLVGFLFAVTIHVPASAAPDERRHIGNIMLYAARPWNAGPFLQDVDASKLWLGEVTRFPAYLYYYLMSFPAKGTQALGLHLEQTVMVLRSIDVLAAGAGLYALRAMFRNAGVPTAIGLLATVVTASTGRYAWQAATISYDAPSMAAFFLFAAVVVKVARGGGLRTLAWLVVTAMLALMFKYSQAPLVLAGAFFAVLFRYRVDGFSWLRHPVRRAVSGFRRTAVAVRRPGGDRRCVARPGARALRCEPARLPGTQPRLRRDPQPRRVHELRHLPSELQRGPDPRPRGRRRHARIVPAGLLPLDVDHHLLPVALLLLGSVAALAPEHRRRAVRRRRQRRCRGDRGDPDAPGAPERGHVVAGSRPRRLHGGGAVLQRRDRGEPPAGLRVLGPLPVAGAADDRGRGAARSRLVDPTAARSAATVAWVVVIVVGVVLFVFYNPISAFFPYANSAAWYSSWARDVLPQWLTGVRS